jgi:hypothetical protein
VLQLNGTEWNWPARSAYKDMAVKIAVKNVFLKGM